MALTPQEIKDKITALYTSYVGGFLIVEIKEVLNNIADALGTSSGGVANLDIVEVPKTASFSIADADQYKRYVVNSSSAVVITVPSGLTSGKWWEIERKGTGAVSFINGVGATITSPDNRLKLRARYSTARVVAGVSSNSSLEGDIVL